jgi:hypothetical protein
MIAFHGEICGSANKKAETAIISREVQIKWTELQLNLANLQIKKSKLQYKL